MSRMRSVVRSGLAAVLAVGMAVGCTPVARHAGAALGLASGSAGTLATTTVDTSAPAIGSLETSAASLLTTEPARMVAVPTKLELGDDFDVASAMEYVEALAGRIGPRPGGSEGERLGAGYIADRLRAAGYTVRVEQVPLPGGLDSTNVIAMRDGEGSGRFVLGAHHDTKTGVPGANDNATGVAALLVIARALADERPPVDIEFVFFGAEESNDGNPEHHHYGSRHHVAQMTRAERDSVVGMLSVDMIGYGNALTVRTMRRGPQSLSNDFIGFARERDVRIGFKLDEGPSGWSDHEAYELAGLPAAWVEWRDDPVYHTPADTSEHLQRERIRIVGQLVLDYVRALDAQRVERLR